MGLKYIIKSHSAFRKYKVQGLECNLGGVNMDFRGTSAQNKLLF